MFYSKTMDSSNILKCRRSNLRSITFDHVDLTLPPVASSVLGIEFYNEEAFVPSDLRKDWVLPFCTSDLIKASVINVYSLTCGEDVKKVFSINMDVKDSKVPFKPGDTIAILPCNFDSEVDEFACLLNMKDELLKKCCIHVKDGLKKKPQLQHIPPVSSLHHLLKSCVDIRAIPKKALLRVLSEYTSDEHEKMCLQVLCSKEGSHIYSSYILEPGTTIQDILCAFPSCKPPIERILEQLPRLQPRPYSIASSPLLLSNELRIVLSLVEYPMKGVCSGWLHDILQPYLETDTYLDMKMNELSLRCNETSLQIPMYFRTSGSFNLPEDPLKPLILIGPGTGVAPFLGFLQHRAAQKRNTPDLTFGEIWLFYGCRYPVRDYLFRSEINQYVEEGVLTKLFVSFSRDNNSDVKYVQDNIKKQAKIFIHQILKENSLIYVCGDAKKMVKDVWETIVHSISSETELSEADAQSLLLTKQKEGVYKQDVWM